jgi:hypothetical protein
MDHTHEYCVPTYLFCLFFYPFQECTKITALAPSAGDGTGIDFMNINFGQNIFAQIFILKF